MELINYFVYFRL